jgi:LuxR family maltose regulon positive regulatory protein
MSPVKPSAAESRGAPTRTAATALLHASPALVEAKLRPPRQRHASIERPRLLDLLLAEDGPPVVAMIAAPGYGKTTLLVQWLAHEPRPAAWLTVDDLDNDPALLLAYVAAAFDRLGPIDDAVRSGLLAQRQRILATAVPRLVSDLYRWRQPAILVLDDAHRLVDRTALDALAALLDHLPPGFRVAIAARSEPDLPFARLRAAGSLLEIGTGQLALTEPEIAEVVAADRHLLRPEAIRAVRERTEGWAAGIHLAVLALDRGEDGAVGLDTVSGRDRYIAAYFRSEFQRSLEPDDVAVLTRTSILETVTPEIAEAVAGIPGAWERLSALAPRNLLIQEVGTSERAIRYHTLLRDFLQGELDQREPGARLDLHRRAAAWFASARELDLAVEHAAASGDADLAARLVTAAAVTMFYGGQPATVDRWLRSFGPGDFERFPPLAVIAGWIALLNGSSAAADRIADIVERARYDGPPADGSASFESGRAMLLAVMGRRGPADVLANARLAATAEGPGSPWRANALWLLGAAHLLQGRPDEADTTLAEAVAAGAAAAGPAVAALANRAQIAMARGDWAAAEAFHRESRLRLTSTHLEEILPALIVHAVGARLAVHRGDVAGAREDLVRAQIVRPLASHAAPWFGVGALLEVARAYVAISDPGGAQVALREAEAIVRRRPALGTLTAELVAMRRTLADAVATLGGSSALTGAELRLLPLLPTYLTFQEIADRLCVSRNTVKTQAMAIYGKLQASSRGEAVERAVELGLLEPFPGLEPARRPSAD